MATNNNLNLGVTPLPTSMGGTGVSSAATYPTSGTVATSDGVGSIFCVTDVLVAYSALATGGSVLLHEASTETERWQVLAAYTSAVGSTNFSGALADRLIVITDNTSNYGTLSTSLLAAVLSISATYGLGLTEIALPTGNSILTPTLAGSDIVAKYSGGTTDYTGGEVRLSLVLRKYAD